AGTLILALYRIFDNNSYLAIRAAVQKAGLDAVFVTLAFWFAGITALFMRSSKIREKQWSYFDQFRNIPVSSYFWIAAAASVAAFPGLMLEYVVYYKFVSSSVPQTPVALAQVALTNVGVALSWGIQAISLCILTDCITRNVIRNEKVLYCMLGTA